MKRHAADLVGAPAKRAKAEAKVATSGWRPDCGYKFLSFCAFVAERQAVHSRRQDGRPRAEWTDDE
eukprot:7387972-Prymnesium_polylepis.1